MAWHQFDVICPRLSHRVLGTIVRSIVNPKETPQNAAATLTAAPQKGPQWGLWFWVWPRVVGRFQFTEGGGWGQPPDLCQPNVKVAKHLTGWGTIGIMISRIEGNGRIDIHIIFSIAVNP